MKSRVHHLRTPLSSPEERASLRGTARPTTLSHPRVQHRRQRVTFLTFFCLILLLILDHHILKGKYKINFLASSYQSVISGYVDNNEPCNVVFSIVTDPSRGSLLNETLKQVMRECPDSIVQVFSSHEQDSNSTQVVFSLCRAINRTLSPNDTCLIRLHEFGKQEQDSLPGAPTVATQEINFWRAFVHHSKDHIDKAMVFLENDVILSKSFRPLLLQSVKLLKNFTNNKPYMLNLYNPTFPQGRSWFDRDTKRKYQLISRCGNDPKSVLTPPCVISNGYNFGTQGVYFSSHALIQHLAEFMGKLLRKEDGRQPKGYGDMLMRAFFWDDQLGTYKDQGNPELYTSKPKGFINDLYHVYSLKFSLVDHVGFQSTAYKGFSNMHVAYDFIDEFPELLDLCTRRLGISRSRCRTTKLKYLVSSDREQHWLRRAKRWMPTPRGHKRGRSVKR